MSTTGNTAGMTVSVAGVAPPGITQDECKKLDEKNKKEREKVADSLQNKSDLTQEETKTLAKATGGGMTISSAFSQVPGAGGTFSASSSGCAQAQNPSLVPGGTSEQKCGCNSETRSAEEPTAEQQEKLDKAGTLCDKEYVHPGGGKGAHAEAKIANQMSNSSPMRGGSMLLNIDWRSNAGGTVRHSGMPCPTCHAMLCHAAKECDIEIFICDKDGKPQPLSTKDDCTSDDSYEDLCVRVDGNISPGR